MSIRRKKEVSNEYNVFNWLRQKLRKLSYQWPPRNKAKQLAWVERGQYRCAECTRQEIEKSWHHTEIVIDHIIPIIDPEKGFTTLDDFIMKLFCPVDGFQILCKQCHQLKTSKENEIRKANKK